MKRFLKPPPVFSAAAGAVLGFYFLPLLKYAEHILIFFAPVIVILTFSFVLFCKYAGKIDFRFVLGRNLQFALICISVFFIGLAAGYSSNIAGRNEVALGLLPEGITGIEGVLAEDPMILSGGNAMAQITLQRCISSSPNGFIYATARGKVTVFFPETSAEKLREFGRGTSVFLEGSLRTSSGSVFNASSVHIVKTAPQIERARTNIRLNLIERAKGKEWGALSVALLLGIRDDLDSDLSAMYRKAGSSYILALSGMHLAVLAAIIAFLLRKPLGIKLSSALGALIIIVYCFLVGPMPSLYRAAIMYFLGAVAILGFLPRKPLAILSLSFLIQIIATPAAGHSIGFILSYLALFGIIVIGQPLYEIFAGKVPDFLMQPLSVSCGAFLATAGVTGTVFGYVAPVGIIAGLVLIPLTTLYMILSLLWLVLESLFSAPLSILYKLMESIVSIAAKAPAIITKSSKVIFISIAISVVIIVFEYFQSRKRLKLDKLDD